MLERKKMLNVKFESCSSRSPWHLTFLDFCFCWETKNLLPPSTHPWVALWSWQWKMEGDFRISLKTREEKNVKCQVWKLLLKTTLAVYLDTWHFSIFAFAEKPENLLPPSTHSWVALWRPQWKMEGDFRITQRAQKEKNVKCQVWKLPLKTTLAVYLDTWHFSIFAFAEKSKNLLPPSTKFGIVTWRPQWKMEGDFRFSQMPGKKKMSNVKFESCPSKPHWPPTLTLDISWFLLLLRNQKSPSTFH